MARGWTVEHISWTNPGRVSCADLRPPPIVDFPSIITTDLNLWMSVMAADKPLGPEPITTASYVFFDGMVFIFIVSLDGISFS